MREFYRIDSGMRQGCIVSFRLFIVNMDAVVKEGMGRRGKRGDCLASCMLMTWFCMASQAMVGCFVEVVWKRGLKVNARKSKVMVLGGEERLEFVWMGCIWSMCQNLNIWDVLDESGTDEAEYYRTTSKVCWVSGEWIKSQMHG